jgi:hypothetical protein
VMKRTEFTAVCKAGPVPAVILSGNAKRDDNDHKVLTSIKQLCFSEIKDKNEYMKLLHCKKGQ